MRAVPQSSGCKQMLARRSLPAPYVSNSQDRPQKPARRPAKIRPRPLDYYFPICYSSITFRVIEQLVSLLVWGTSGRGFEFRSPDKTAFSAVFFYARFASGRMLFSPPEQPAPHPRPVPALSPMRDESPAMLPHPVTPRPTSCRIPYFRLCLRNGV